MLSYFQVLSSTISANGGIFHVSLNPDCAVYQGHFPGNPISPGVCNILMIKQCLVQCIPQGQWLLQYIQQCRLTTLVTPIAHPQMDVRIEITEQTDDKVKFRATIGKDDAVYLDLKAEVVRTA